MGIYTSHMLSERQAPVQCKIDILKLIKQLCETLEPLEKATDKYQNDEVTASYVRPCVRGLQCAAATMKPSTMLTTIKSTIESG